MSMSTNNVSFPLIMREIWMSEKLNKFPNKCMVEFIIKSLKPQKQINLNRGPLDRCRRHQDKKVLTKKLWKLAFFTLQQIDKV